MVRTSWPCCLRVDNETIALTYIRITTKSQPCEGFGVAGESSAVWLSSDRRVACTDSITVSVFAFGAGYVAVFCPAKKLPPACKRIYAHPPHNVVEALQRRRRCRCRRVECVTSITQSSFVATAV